MPLTKDSSVEKMFAGVFIGTGLRPKGKFAGKKGRPESALTVLSFRGLLYSFCRNSSPPILRMPLADCGIFLAFLRLKRVLLPLITFSSFRPCLLSRLLALSLPFAPERTSFFGFVVSSMASIAETQVSSRGDSLEFYCQSGMKFSS